MLSGSEMNVPIPVVLFIYARCDHLARVLACLRENKTPFLEVFSDGSKDASDEANVTRARALVRQVDWCEVRITERKRNLGLGRNVISGIDEIVQRHDAFVVWEDDLIAVPGTYAWTVAALRHFVDTPRVMSVTAWNHPRVTPPAIGNQPYFDGRAECWVWGAWSRSWRGMSSQDAMAKLNAASRRGVRPASYGADLPIMAKAESQRNTWAVRWLYHHMQHHGLCVRPPWSMVEHIGFDASATNAQTATTWANPPLRNAPPIPPEWPEPQEHSACRGLWRAANPSRLRAALQRVRARLRLG